MEHNNDGADWGTSNLEVVIEGQACNPQRPHTGPFPHDAAILKDVATLEELQILEEYLAVAGEWLVMKSQADCKRLHLPVPEMDWTKAEPDEGDVCNDDDDDEDDDGCDGKDDGGAKALAKVKTRAKRALRRIMRRVFVMAGLPTDLLGDDGEESSPLRWFERYVLERTSGIKSLSGAKNQKWHNDVKGHERVIEEKRA